MRPSLLTRKPVPWATGLPSLSDVMIETTTPFAALAIAGMSFRGGADCAATTPAASKIREKHFIIIDVSVVFAEITGNPSWLRPKALYWTRSPTTQAAGGQLDHCAQIPPSLHIGLSLLLSVL